METDWLAAYYARFSPEPFDLAGYLRRWYPGTSPEPYESKTGSRGVIYRLSQCPFNLDHVATASVIQWSRDGTIFFRCWHHSCAGLGWTDFVRLHESGTHWQTESDASRKYRLYMASAEWSRFRAAFLAENPSCDCGQPAKQVHHSSYSSLYRESDRATWHTLAPKCRVCHAAEHPEKC